MAKTSNGGWEMSIRKKALLLVPVLLVLACATFAIAGNVVDYTYDADGNITDALTTTATSVNITASPTSIEPGGTVTLSWTSLNADSCTIEPDIGSVPVSGSRSVSPSATTTYTITATRGSETDTSSVTITVTANPPPTVTITANPASIQEGQSATLSWTSSNATSCSIDQGIGGVELNGTRSVSPAVTTTYTITATGAGGTTTAYTTITVTAAPPGPTPTVTINSNPQSISYGGSSTLSWSSTNADWCEIQPGIGEVNLSGSMPVSPLVTTTYAITAHGQGGTATSTVTVTVAAPPAPTVQISANPTTIVVGSSTTLSWTSTNADSCDIQPGVGTVGPNWSITVSPSTTTTYTITAIGPGGTATDTVTVTVTSAPVAPTVTITANPASIVTGASSTLSWSSTNADSCTINQGIGTVNTSGSATVTPTVTTTYTITATGTGGTATNTVTVTVTAAPSAPTVSISANPASIDSGGSSTLTWSSTNADSCSIDHGIGTVNTGDSTTVSPTTTTTYTITATGPGGTATNSVTVTIISCDLSLHDETITAGNTIEHTTVCSITAGPNYVIQPNATVTLLAGQDITLTPGFEARNGCEFRAGYTAAPPSTPTVQISANPATIVVGSSSTLTWTSTHAASCTIDQGIGTVNTSGSITVSPITSKTYTITATGPNGTTTKAVTLTVTPLPVPVVSITANPPTIHEGDVGTLIWTSTNAEYCIIDPDIGVVDSNGSTQISPTTTTTYTITAAGEGGATVESLTVAVIPPLPVVSITADPPYIQYGASSTLTWTTTMADSCFIDQGVGAVDISGSTQVSPLATTTYTITATGPGGTTTNTATVSVAPPPLPTVSITANPSIIVAGASTTLTWTSTTATSCNIQPDIGTVGASGSVSVSPTARTTYTITATGPGGTATSTVIVTVGSSPSAPAVTISASPMSIQEDGSSTLTWNSINATSCTIDQGVGTVNTSGSTTVSPTTTTTYTITATGAEGTATNSVTITVISCDISLHDETIPAGSIVEQTTTCTITAGPNYIIQPNATVTFQAGEEIILNPGFEARNGCEFRAMHTP